LQSIYVFSQWNASHGRQSQSLLSALPIPQGDKRNKMQNRKDQGLAHRRRLDAPVAAVQDWWYILCGMLMLPTPW